MNVAQVLLPAVLSAPQGESAPGSSGCANDSGGSTEPPCRLSAARAGLRDRGNNLSHTKKSSQKSRHCKTN